MIKILVVEDELLIAHYLKDVLEAEGYQVVGLARTGNEAIEHFKNHQPDLVCMDIQLKGETDGISTALQMRQLGPFILVYLTAFGDRTMVGKAQETHPAGFLVKPVTDRTVVATIETALFNHARQQDPPAQPSSNPGFSLDMTTGRFSTEDHSIQLTPHEALLLDILIRERGKVVGSETLSAQIWPAANVSETSIKTLVWRLRRKLPDKNLVKTVPGFGYRLD